MQGLQAPDHILRTTELQKTFPETPFGVKLYTPKLQVKLNEDFTSQLNVLPECSVFPPLSTSVVLSVSINAHNVSHS